MYYNDHYKKIIMYYYNHCKTIIMYFYNYQKKNNKYKMQLNSLIN